MRDDDEQAKPDIPGGYIMVARELLESPIWERDPHYGRLWVYLMLKARWSDTPVTREGVTTNRGQLLKSLRTIRRECRYRENQAWREWSLSKIHRMIAWMEGEGMIHTKTTHLGTLFSLRNFNKYQDADRYSRHLGTDLGTGSERQEEGEEGVFERRSHRGSENSMLPSREEFLDAIENQSPASVFHLVSPHLEGFDRNHAWMVCDLPDHLLDLFEERGEETAADSVGAYGTELEVVADALRDMIRKGLLRFDEKTFFRFLVSGAEAKAGHHD